MTLIKQNHVKLPRYHPPLMTKQKAIKILERYSQYINYCSQRWKENSETFKTPDLRDITRTMSELMEGESRIIRSAIDELKTTKK